MDVFTKQMLMYGSILLIGAIYVFTGAAEAVHNGFADALEPMVANYAGERAATVSHSIAYGLQFLAAAVLLITPMSALGGTWYLYLGYTLTLGFNGEISIFLISVFLNKVVAVLCLVLFIYSLYLQYQWVEKLSVPLPYGSKDKDLSRLI